MSQHLRLTREQYAAIEARRKAGNKFNARKKMVDGIVFDSTREATAYQLLKIRETAGEITGLQCQTTYDLHVNGILICKYTADFTFIENNQNVVADAKGMKTPVYSLKKKLMRAIHGITIREM